MTAPSPLPLRTRTDDNLATDINSLQTQTGDLSNLVTDYQDKHEFVIIAAVPLTSIFSVSGDQTDVFIIGQLINVSNSTNNDFNYTITNLIFDFENNKTDITVFQTINSNVADGIISFDFDDLDSNRDLTSAFIDLKNKILSRANNYRIVSPGGSGPGVVEVSPGVIDINVNGPVINRDGNPITAGDLIVISETGLYDTVFGTGPHPIISVDDPDEPFVLRIAATFTTDVPNLPAGIITFLDGRGGKIIQHGIELLPAGIIIMITGESGASESNTPLAGAYDPPTESILNNCPAGYIECDNNSQINDFNSVFNGSYTPDMRSLFIRGENVGLNTPTTINVGIGSIAGSDFHIHDLQNHKHTFDHFHDHDHNLNHNHNIPGHTHGIGHEHKLAGHTHSVSVKSNKDKGQGGNDSKIDDDTGEPDHTHNVTGNTGGIVPSTILFGFDPALLSSSEPAFTSGDRAPEAQYINESFDSIINNPSKETATPNIDNVDFQLNVMRFKAVKYCMKI